MKILQIVFLKWFTRGTTLSRATSMLVAVRLKVVPSLFFLFFAVGCNQPTTTKAQTTPFPFEIEENLSDKIDGLSFVAPPSPFQGNPMEAVKSVNADWIAVIPYGYTRVGKPAVKYGSDFQWWGEKPEGAKKTIEIAHENGLKVMLKPQVYVPGSWAGGLDFETDEAWAQWENDYQKFIMAFAKIAVETDVKMFCIGTEFKMSTRKRPDFWRKLIKDIRKIYSGKLVYAANWDDYKEVSFWEELDFIGIDAYFPLVDADTPSVAALTKAWEPITEEIEHFSKEKKKNILFTEFGYLSVGNCAWRNWELEKVIGDCQINELAQANALHTLLQVFMQKDWWSGGFLWKWFPEGQGHEGYPQKDYTPQGKQAEQVIRGWYEGC